MLFSDPHWLAPYQWRRCEDAADGGGDGSVGIRDIKLEEADES